MGKIKKILVANRGEIALRIMRSAKEMGIQTVAVFSDADRTMPFVRYADEAVAIGAAPSSASYLVMEKIIAAAKQTGADAIHPGYGFLSERESFAEQVKKSGLTFIGPGAAAIKILGNKIAAKETAKKLKVPLVPGTEHAISDMSEAEIEATRIGFPVLLKAAAGGGGKGMRIVEKKEELATQFERATSEALSAFGDGSVFIEKYIASPRHIEIQVLADTHGNSVYLFERECSIQRRHQKLIEEAPSPVMTESLRKKMGESAVALAKASGYVNAGTVEFLVDEKMNYYFLEMNTRLQVEHPVTELITGIDIVKEQIKIAQGEKLSFTQNDLQINGHAIELRVNAEDPYEQFLPNVGKLSVYRKPSGPGVRVDDGYEEGMEIPIYYDPMISKLITYGQNRDEAISRMERAIAEYQITGVKSTLEFGKWVMGHEQFRNGETNTKFIEQYFSPEHLSIPSDDEMEAAAIVAAMIVANGKKNHVNNNEQPATTSSRWKKNRLNIEL